MVYPSQNPWRDKVAHCCRAHQIREWTESPQENPVLEYKPGCRHVFLSGESQYQVVFAYAYIAAVERTRGFWLVDCVRLRFLCLRNTELLLRNLYVNF